MIQRAWALDLSIYMPFDVNFSEPFSFLKMEMLISLCMCHNIAVYGWIHNEIYIWDVIWYYTYMIVYNNSVQSDGVLNIL